MKQKGFTLIELVVVIIILGILAVTALPKFVNLQGEARTSTLQGMKAALEGAATLTYSKAAIQGRDTLATSTVNLVGSGTPVNTAFGYPLATIADLQIVLETTFGTASTSTNDWWAEATTTPATTVIRPKGFAKPTTPDATNDCSVTYTQVTATGVRPTVTVWSGGC